MKNMGIWGWVSFTLVIIGALNWGFLGAFDLNVVGAILGGSTSYIARLVYILVGLAGIFLIYQVVVKKDSR